MAERRRLEPKNPNAISGSQLAKPPSNICIVGTPARHRRIKFFFFAQTLHFRGSSSAVTDVA